MAAEIRGNIGPIPETTVLGQARDLDVVVGACLDTPVAVGTLVRPTEEVGSDRTQTESDSCH